MAEYISFQPSDFFSSKLYTGNSSSAEIPVTGVGFQPDFVWAKNRDATYDHFLFDSVRGATKYWRSNEQAVEGTNAQTLKSFDSDGYTMGTDSDVNQSTSGFASWNWKMGTTSGIGGSPSTTPEGYSFSATAGQSIIYYIGTSVAGGGPIATLPHGLTKAPEFIIVKNLTAAARDTATYHVSTGNTKRIYLNQAAAPNTTSTAWNDTTPGATVFTVGGNEAVNELSKYLVAYCFTSIKGYSKFSSYMGNNNAEGPFIYTGFRPAFVMAKSVSTTHWNMFDDKRATYNPANYPIWADSNAAEQTDPYPIDMLSNGFKVQTSSSQVNNGGTVHIYAAFAEFPTVSSNDVPGVAR